MVLVSKDLQNEQDIREYIEQNKGKTWPPTRFAKDAAFKRHYYSTNPEIYFSPDDPIDLRAAIHHDVSPSDIVLTTPQHAMFFREAQVSNISVYDMHPLQLANHDNTEEERYWSDIFDQKLLKQLLSKSQPSLMYLSNIPEWPYDGIEQVVRLASRLDDYKPLQKVMLANSASNKILCDLFADELVKLGWERRTYQHNKKSNAKIISLLRIGQ